MDETIKTPLLELFGIKVPIVLAGMNGVATAKLAAAVSNAGGLGVIGGVGYTPKMLRKEVEELKSYLDSPDLPFGIDLLLPKVGEGARKTNYDYTKGKLPELIDIICEAKPKVFVSAVGVPPDWAVKKLHENGILVQNMIGHPRHVSKALDLGVDIICAQGGEGGGHTGDVATTILIPQVVDACKGRKSPLTGKQVQVIAAGGIFDGRGLAAALSLGASGVWVGTRFIAAEESGANKLHVSSVLKADASDTIRTTIYTGRPMRVIRNKVNVDWEENRRAEMKELQSKGIIPFQHDLAERQKRGEEMNFLTEYPLLAGQAIGAVKEIKPAKAIIEEMMHDAIAQLKTSSSQISRL